MDCREGIRPRRIVETHVSGTGYVFIPEHQLAPYMEPGHGACVECAIALTIRARDLGPSGGTLRDVQDDPGVRYTFLRVVEMHAVGAGQPLRDALPGRSSWHLPGGPSRARRGGAVPARAPAWHT